MLPKGISKAGKGILYHLARNRITSREHKKLEKMLNPFNEYGIHDSTPYQAVKQIRKEQYSNYSERS
jgi:hypothetical protein